MTDPFLTVKAEVERSLQEASGLQQTWAALQAQGSKAEESEERQLCTKFNSIMSSTEM